MGRLLVRASSRGGYLWPFVSAVLLGLATTTGSFPAGAIFGLIPLLVFLHDAVTPRRVLRGFALFALAHYLITLHFLYTLATYSYLVFLFYIIFAVVMAVHVLLIAFLCRLVLIRTGLPLWVVVPPVWIAMEYLRFNAPIKLTAPDLVYTLSSYPLLIQTADIVGAVGISFLAVLINALAADLLIALRSARQAGMDLRVPAGTAAVRPRARRIAVPAIVLALVLTGPPAYGVWRLKTLRTEPGPRLSVVQPNPTREQRFDRSKTDEVWERLARLTKAAASERPAMILWPEASLPAAWVENPFNPAELADVKERIGRIARESGAWLVAGGVYVVWRARDRFDMYNSALVLDPAGRLHGVYSKNILVPVTEGDPFMGFNVMVRGKDRNPAIRLGVLTPGQETPAFDMGRVRFGLMVCYEQLFPQIARRETLEGADFLVCVTNDSWFGRTFVPHWFSGSIALRAVENRRPVVRAALTGVSLIVDPLGRVTARTPLFEEAVLAGTLALGPEGSTFYARHGDWVPHASIIASVVLVSGALILGRRHSPRGRRATGPRKGKTAHGGEKAA